MTAAQVPAPAAQGPAELARAGTERIAVVAASLVLALSGAALLPLLLPWHGALGIGAGVALLALAPFVLFRVLKPARFAAARPLRPGLVSLSLGCALAGVLALVPLWRVHRAQLRVLNHGDEPIALLVDGRHVLRVEPSSGESERAGMEAEVPAGPRELRVLAAGDGRELARASVLFSGGQPHLYAPLSEQYCFRIERRSYGAAEDAVLAPQSDEPLDSATPFWTLPEGIAWFVPNPEPGEVQTSGGTLRAVRQTPCRLRDTQP